MTENISHSPTETSPTPHLSIVIRCRNQAQTLEAILRVLSLQECSFAWELIVVDNESTDDTSRIAREFGANVVFISRSDYTHGRALNQGLAVARGHLALILSAHSLPIGRHFLASAVTPFDDPQIAAAMCIKSDLVEFTSHWHEPEDIYWPPDKRPATRAEMFTGVRKLMNSGLVIRRAVWEKIPFDETLESSEDKHWAMAVLCEDHKIRRCCEAVYVYLLSRDRNTSAQRVVRSALAAYRITGQAPLTRRQYVRRVIRSFVVAMRQAYWHIRDELIISRGLMEIPQKAQQSPAIGSRAENDAHR